ncbi:MAG: peptide chain release factor-like protein [candidate division WOR-3 bacterium]|nr:peptide chain release factor-like protein [candidate division WOR-3 bacterium]MDH7518657.1 peptide chain release factor-like protein [bacterium]
MLRFGVSAKKESELAEKMAQYGIREEDLIERFVRSRGPGGQNVNKVATGVYLKHLPTGIEVKVTRERSQALNRFLARRILTEKVAAQILKIETEREREIARIRRQKRRRSRRAKEKVLRLKHLIAEKKELRKPPDD